MRLTHARSRRNNRLMCMATYEVDGCKYSANPVTLSPQVPLSEDIFVGERRVWGERVTGFAEYLLDILH